MNSIAFKVRLSHACVFLVILMGLTILVTRPAIAKELSFLKKNPELKAKLLKWEQDAPNDVKKEIKIFRTGYAADKGNAALRLRKMGERANGAILALIETFGDKTELLGIRQAAGPVTTSPADEAANTLAKVGESAVEPLVAALKDEDSYIRLGAAKALLLKGDKRAIDSLVAALKEKDPYIRKEAVWALGREGDLLTIELLITALRDTDPSVRKRAVGMLSFRKKDHRSVELLIAALKDKDTSVREEAAFTLSWFKDPRVVDALIDALNDKDPSVFHRAAHGLGWIGDKRAVGPLIEALKDNNANKREAAAFNLNSMTGQDFGQDYGGWKRWWENQDRKKK